MVEGDDPRVIGYYTLSAGGVIFENLPDEVRRKLPRYPMPVAHLGRMAVDKDFQGRGYGALLLLDALKRALAVSADMAIAGVEVRAKSPSVKAFYARYGFIELLDDHLHMYLPIDTIRALS
ncbi:GCN5-related N-acetyltransferase [Fimbriimonas ginsengisoli Gsoil 348]|uniref:GCN5-related N-acetyltransferase n=2 Tax=Fimbriimonas ginsengisoli TaxID=1005039 RepID=A0A068NR99_FIMGI|nr:GCN5-related N-acetyltransferase [Fimbriimonas ginsengisoli Gsoil 348]